MLKSEQFITIFRNEKSENIIRFAMVDPNYISGRPSLIFDGESIPTVKKYPYLGSYTPKANDRVQIIGGVIQGDIN